MPINGIEDAAREMDTVDIEGGQAYSFARWLADLAGNHGDATNVLGWIAPLSASRRNRGGHHRYRRAAVLLTTAATISVGTYFGVTGEDRTLDTASGNSLARIPTSTSQLSPMTEVSAVVSGNASGRCLLGPALAGHGGARVDYGHHAIMAFEHAYYVERDGRQARDAVAPDAAVPGSEQIQAGIDSVPMGTTYCVRIRALVVGQYLVELTEKRPDEPETVWNQRISTAQVNGRVVITSIAAAT